jgi:hypothetical protein
MGGQADLRATLEYFVKERNLLLRLEIETQIVQTIAKP